MAATPTILFTVMPRGISVNPQTLPVSVFVSPRLMGDTKLGAFPDWVDWTARLKELGLTLTFRNGAKRTDVKINGNVLQPNLWRELFNRETLVRSRKFDDFTGRGILSFSVRESLSVLKAVYQQGSVLLALPNPGLGDKRQAGNRGILQGMLDGLDVHWNGDIAKSWRARVRHSNAGSDLAGQSGRSLKGALDDEGLVMTGPDPGGFRGVAMPFSVFYHMPTPLPSKVGDLKIDPKAIDFHQALSSLGSYPELLRALGLVFDLELPKDALAPTPPGAFDKIAVEKTSFPWQLPAKSPALDTAYSYVTIGQDVFFLAGSRTMTPGSGPSQAIGLLNLDPQRFGLAQVDVDGGMHKAIMLAETWNNPDSERNRYDVTPQEAPHPDVYDPEATLPSLRSGGLQLYADRRGLHMLDSFQQGKAFNDALEAGGAQPRPFFAEDLARGYRLDIWDSATKSWHSLHQRKGDYQIGDHKLPFQTAAEEGFLQFGVTQPAPGADPPDNKDLYVHEAIARWAGWSLSVPMPGKALSRYGDPDKAIPPNGDDPAYRTDEAITPYKVRAVYKALPGSLPRLKFGRRYRIRARVVDLAGNSLKLGEPLADALAMAMGLPRDLEGFTYLRYEPVDAPMVVISDPGAVTLPGSAVDRLVIRTYNADPSQDTQAADLTAGERHILPPRTSVEMAERLGMLDDAAGKLKSDAATYKLAAERDAAELPQTSIEIAGHTDNYPIVTGAGLDPLPYLPDPLSRGAAFRDLPGTPEPTVGRAAPGTGATGPISYVPLTDANPRPGSASLISFNATNDWQKTNGFRLVLGEPEAGSASAPPSWDPAARTLTVYLPKGRTAVTPLSSYLNNDDLKLMGIWKWMMEIVDRATIFFAAPQNFQPGSPVDLIAHVLQRTGEGGHWMLTPPRLLTLVHAVQQPIGVPRFAALHVDHQDQAGDTTALQTARIRGRIDPAELAPITAWRLPGSTEAYLTGAIQMHGASTAKLDLTAEWTDPVDDLSAPAPDTRKSKAHVDEIPLAKPIDGYLRAPGKDYRYSGYYDPEHDQVAMVRYGDRAGKGATYDMTFSQAAPRHQFHDSKRHRVSYTATASSRYREYFPQDQDLDFTRSSEAVMVDVPASARPLAPDVVYVVPSFSWQRQTDTNIKRSVRFGGGLRVYLNRGWYSSGEGELLGVALWSSANGTLDDKQRDKFKSYITQWGMDPIWQTGNLGYVPSTGVFSDAEETDYGVSLEESSAAKSATEPGRVDVVGFTPQFDESRGLWFADLTINAGTTYGPFVRLALVRYQPHALDDARISRVVLAGFSQLTPDRSATVLADPHHPRTIRVTVSGVAPRGPLPEGPGAPKPARPTHVLVRVQQRGAVASDLSWDDAPAAVATVTQLYEGPGLNQPELALWVGNVTFAAAPAPNQFRILVEEFEYISATYADQAKAPPSRMIYAEVFELDSALVSE